MCCPGDFYGVDEAFSAFGLHAVRSSVNFSSPVFPVSPVSPVADFRISSLPSLQQ